LIAQKQQENIGMTKPTLHLRTEKRADAVEEKERQPGKPFSSAPSPDRRTSPQDPVKKTSGAGKEEDVLIAELDQGPLEA
jgi:hypothetical protein